MPLYPLLLAPIYKEKVWGGRTLERFGRALPGGPETPIGESWELADLAATSPSGGGGEAAYSVIRNGPLMKRTIGEVIRDFGPVVTGSMTLAPDGSFPLLFKYLDARENLSVQVHPSEAYAADHPDAHLKSEAWYVVAADPGATIYRGVVEGTDPDRFRAAIEDGSVADLLNREPAEAGQCIYLPSGTVHALGAGVLVAEVQTASDTTFRVFDWGRTDRELHVDQAMACIEFAPVAEEAATPGEAAADGDWVTRPLVACEHFRMSEWNALSESMHTFASDELSVLMIIRGSATLSWGEETRRTLSVTAGDTVLLPAGLASVDVGAEEDLTLLEVTPPRNDR
ncbi:MAG: type I phosphomannose isomerase catalytic subunit [Longimicrobiales bacterium]